MNTKTEDINILNSIKNIFKKNRRYVNQDAIKFYIIHGLISILLLILLWFIDNKLQLNTIINFLRSTIAFIIVFTLGSLIYGLIYKLQSYLILQFSHKQRINLFLLFTIPCLIIILILKTDGPFYTILCSIIFSVIFANIPIVFATPHETKLKLQGIKDARDYIRNDSDKFTEDYLIQLEKMKKEQQKYEETLNGK